MGDLQLILVDINPAVCRAWETAFATLPNVQIVLGRFESVPEWDAIVAPGNSFGIMDGGLDLAICRFYQIETENCAQDRVQEHIRESFGGELPVGNAALVHMIRHRHAWIVYAPTMRIPMDIRGTDHVYLAMKASLREIAVYNARWPGAPRMQIRSVVVPALGMGTGRVPPDEGARQMALAYEYWLHPPERMTWDAAVRRHNRIVAKEG